MASYNKFSLKTCIFEVQCIAVKKRHFYGTSTAWKNSVLSVQISAILQTDHVPVQVYDIKIGIYN